MYAYPNLNSLNILLILSLKWWILLVILFKKENHLKYHCLWLLCHQPEHTLSTIFFYTLRFWLHFTIFLRTMYYFVDQPLWGYSQFTHTLLFTKVKIAHLFIVMFIPPQKKCIEIRSQTHQQRIFLSTYLHRVKVWFGLFAKKRCRSLSVYFCLLRVSDEDTEKKYLPPTHTRFVMFFVCFMKQKSLQISFSHLKHITWNWILHMWMQLKR